MSSKTNGMLKILAIITIVGAYVMIVLGVLVSTTGSGQGCGNSWPFCHGEIIPGSLSIQGLTEYSHRIMSSLDGLLVVVLSAWSWWAYRKDTWIKFYALMGVLFILIQGALGAVTVVYEGTWALNWLLSIHFGLSLIAFAYVVLLATRLFEMGRSPEARPEARPLNVPSGLQFAFWALAVYTYLVVYTGAYVQHTGAVAGCYGYAFPSCTTYLPDFMSLPGIQMLHRYAAGLLWFATLAVLLVILLRFRDRRGLVAGAWWSMVLVTLQALVGVANVLTTGQMVPALIHATLVSAYFAVLCYLCAQVGWPGRHARPEVPPLASSLEPEAASARK